MFQFIYHSATFFANWYCPGPFVLSDGIAMEMQSPCTVLPLNKSIQTWLLFPIPSNLVYSDNKNKTGAK